MAARDAYSRHMVVVGDKPRSAQVFRRYRDAGLAKSHDLAYHILSILLSQSHITAVIMPEA